MPISLPKMISETQKQIYNLYIKALRNNKGLPYKFRKKWDDFESKPDYVFICKIDQMFKKYPHFFCQDFFDAPYKLYNNSSDTYTLRYYASAKAVSDYTSLLRLRILQDPENQMDYIKESLMFVFNFCKEHKIKLNQYCDFKSVAQNDCLNHLRQYSISWYVAIELPGFYNLLYNLPRDEFSLYFGDVDITEISNNLKTSSVKARITEGIKRIDKKLKTLASTW